MGVTVKTKNRAMDLGYSGFNRLRTKVAELAAEDIGRHYKKLEGAWFITDKEWKKKFFENYNKKITELSERYNGEKDGILHFLYASDGGAEIPVKACKEIWEVIKEYDDDIRYGYSGRKDCAMFKDFKQIVKDCIDNDCSMVWF